MTQVTRTALVLSLLTCHPADGAQLPPEIRLDQLLVRTERLIEADDLDAAIEAMDEASALAAEHGLELPPDFRFEQAQTHFAVGLLEAAKESVTAYLTFAGRQAESYLDAVSLLEDVDRILERRDAPECTPEPEGSECWMELASHPGCYVRNPNPQPDETATWTGECSAGFAQGPGTVTWNHPGGSPEHEASRRFGQPHGPSVIRDSEGWVDEGPYRFGKRHGQWVLRFASGGVQEGRFVDGERNGRWVLRFTDAGGTQEGPYLDGKMHGHWVLRFTDDRGIQEGPYKDGKMHGHWVLRFADGQVESGPVANGERHGRWQVASPDGEVTYVEFVHGVRQEP